MTFEKQLIKKLSQSNSIITPLPPGAEAYLTKGLENLQTVFHQSFINNLDPKILSQITMITLIANMAPSTLIEEIMAESLNQGLMKAIVTLFDELDAHQNAVRH